MLLFNPGVARIKCDDCRKWIYDFKTGERTERACGPKREMQPLPQGKEPPCIASDFRCPKIHPDREAEFTLLPENRRTLLCFLQGRVNGFRDWEIDGIMGDNFRILDGIYREYERERANEGQRGFMRDLVNLFVRR